jgi:oxygen-independent coproporphyrinogen-3 oxidase
VKDGLWQPVDDDTEADFYEATHTTLTQAGYVAYETSNFAHGGKVCRHNQHVWRYGDYLGVGAGAHGRITLGGERLATTVVRQPEGYLRRMYDHGEAFAEVLRVDAVTAVQEALFLGLRLKEGVNLDGLAKMNGAAFYEEAVNRVEQDVLHHAGLLETTDGYLRTTPDGQARLNAVLRRLLRPLPAPTPRTNPLFETTRPGTSDTDKVYTAHTRVRFE